MLLEKIGIRKKQISAFLFVSMFVVITSVFGIFQVKYLHGKNYVIFKNQIPEKDISMEARIALDELQRNLMGFALDFMQNDPEKVRTDLKTFRAWVSFLDGAAGSGTGDVIPDHKAFSNIETNDQIKEIAGTILERIDQVESEIDEAFSRGPGNIQETGFLKADFFEGFRKHYDRLVKLLTRVEEVADRDIGNSVKAVEQAKQSAVFWLSVLLGVCLLLALGLGFVMARDSIRPLEELVQFAERLDKGHLEDRIDLRRTDEIGRLGSSLNQVAADLSRVLKQISGGIDTFSQSASILSRNSNQMAANAVQSLEKANTVASAAEEMSTSINSIAASVEQASTNIDTVASATEEISTSISSIESNTERAGKVSVQAKEQTDDAAQQVEHLNQTVQAITEFTEIITSISEQTNMLALNATIEAARAGEAGKGFAVVANEIKELAGQTQGATEKIKEQIGAIRNTTGQTVEKISQVSSVVDEMHGIVETIADSMEQQSSAIKDITENMAQASQGIQEITQNIAENSQAADLVAKDIAEVSEAAANNARNSTEVRANVDEFKTLSEQLSSGIQQFDIGKPVFPIGQVKTAHLAWRIKLENVIEGYTKIDPDQVASDRECEFGKWYFSDRAQILNSFHKFEEIGQLHKKVHDLARQIVEQASENRMDRAKNLLEDFESVRADMFQALDELYVADTGTQV